MNVFETLNSLNVNDRTEKKSIGNNQDLTYLSWPWAWAEVKKKYENAHYEIWKDEKGLPYCFDPRTGYMVYTSVTIEGITHDMWLPVMDGANNTMKAEPYEYTVQNKNFKYAKWDASKQGYYDKYGNRQEEFITKKVSAATMFDINKTIMRCLVKNLAMFGLGLYIFAGEDLPESEEDDEKQELNKPENKEPDIQKPDTKAQIDPKDTIPFDVKRTINRWMIDHEVSADLFKDMRNACITMHLVPDLQPGDMTKEDVDRLLKVIELNFASKIKKVQK